MVLGNANTVRSPADRLAPPVKYPAGSAQANCPRAMPHQENLNIGRNISLELTQISGFSNITRAIPRPDPKSQLAAKPLSLLQ